MIVGGAFRGMKRAVDYSLLYLWAYVVVGFGACFLLGLVLMGSDSGLGVVIVICAHVLSILVILPAALVANFAALRVFRRRSWHREPWRPWVAGTLAVPLCWGGPIAWAYVEGNPPGLLGVLGAEWGLAAYLAGLLVLFSNLALLIAWLLPARRKVEPK